MFRLVLMIISILIICILHLNLAENLSNIRKEHLKPGHEIINLKKKLILLPTSRPTNLFVAPSVPEDIPPNKKLLGYFILLCIFYYNYYN